MMVDQRGRYDAIIMSLVGELDSCASLIYCLARDDPTDAFEQFCARLLPLSGRCILSTRLPE